jgi:cytochrome c oxidase subunit 2
VISRWLPEAASAHASALDAVLVNVHWHIFAVFVVWGIVLATALVRFRSGKHSSPMAAGPAMLWPAIAIGIVIAAEVGLLFASALPAWRARMAPPTSAAGPVFEVRVAAEQFAWNVHYPGPDGAFGRTGAAFISAANPVGIDRADPAAADDIGLLNILTLPVDRTIVVQLTSRDVVHAFTLPEMRVKQDMTPGMTVRTWFTPTRAGAWEILCSQLCGLGHYRMRGEYRVLPGEEWEAWQRQELSRIR